MIFEIKNYPSLQQSVEELCAYLMQHGVSSESIFDCKLVAYELLGNALRHAKESATLQGEVQEGYIQLKIQSKGVRLPKEGQACAEVYAEHGRGLFLINTLCTECLELEEGVLLRIKLEK